MDASQFFFFFFGYFKGGIVAIENVRIFYIILYGLFSTLINLGLIAYHS